VAVAVAVAVAAAESADSLRAVGKVEGPPSQAVWTWAPGGASAAGCMAEGPSPPMGTPQTAEAR
jgi:hypothetical protein